MDIIRFPPRPGQLDPEVAAELRRRGVDLAAPAGAEVTLSCQVCGTQWQVALEQAEKPTEQNHYWWCPNGCNREE